MTDDFEESFPLVSFMDRRDSRDILAGIIDEYIVGGISEFRPYDLTDRIFRKLEQRGWWFVHGGDVERMISQEHPYNVKQGEQLERSTAVVEAAREVIAWAREVGFIGDDAPVEIDDLVEALAALEAK